MNNGAWRVTVPVPREVAKVLGKTRLKRSLSTHSLAEAERLKHGVIAEFLSLISQAKEGKAVAPVSMAPSPVLSSMPAITALAMEMREGIRSSLGDEHAVEMVHVVADQILGEPVGEDPEADRPVFDPARAAKAKAFMEVALGNSTPVRTPLPSFYGEGKWTLRTKADSDRSIGYLEEWCQQEAVPFTIEAITRRVAGRFVSHLKTDGGRPLTNKTINKYLACLSSYWRWLEKRGYVDHGSNPWKGQSLPKEAPKEGENERPFTDEELVTLLKGTPNQPYIRSLMLIAALSGARIDAIVSLKVKDTANGCFRFKPQKREKGSRLVPIHSALEEVVKGLTRGKAPEDDLFPECPPVAPGKPQERSMPAVKAFGYYRKSVGVTDLVEGKRRDRVNFHSFRRWFITKAYQANQPQIVIDKVVGHKPQSVAGSVYLGELDVEQLRTCVENVRLPK